jgi:hypothetical protein
MDQDWTQPTVRIGRLAGKVTVPTFILPPAIAALLHASSFKEYGYMLPTEASNWFMSIGCKGQPADEWRKERAENNDRWSHLVIPDKIFGAKLPAVAWSRETGYGWRDLEYFRSSDVWVELIHGSTGFEFAMQFSGHGDFPEVAPFVPAFGANTEQTIRSCFSSRQGWDFEAAYFSGLDDQYMTLHWPESKEFGENSGAIIGLMDNYSSGEPFEEFVLGWLGDPEIEALLLTADRWQFYPEISCPAAPVPCAARSVAGAVLRNLAGAPKELRLDNILIEQANAIAKAGLAYHEALVDHYRNAVAVP